VSCITDQFINPPRKEGNPCHGKPLPACAELEIAARI
jgi:hypothetical protein